MSRKRKRRQPNEKERRKIAAAQQRATDAAYRAQIGAGADGPLPKSIGVADGHGGAQKPRRRVGPDKPRG